MLKAIITKVSRNVGSPQVDIEVDFYDDQDKGVRYKRVLTYGDLSILSKDPVGTVTDEVKRMGAEYKSTIEKEDVLKTELEGKEILI